jgi:signal transduction histidine kinase
VSEPRRRLGLRARLIISFVGVAAVAAVVPTVYSNLNLNAHVKSAAQARLSRTAMHFADVAGVVYAASGGWTPQARETLMHLTEADGLAARILDEQGKVVVKVAPTSPAQKGAFETSQITVNGSAVGRVSVGQSDGKLLSPVETRLTQQLDRMHLIAGITSAAVALVVALYLAWSLSSPLRRIRTGAERMRGGQLDTRVREGGDEEMRAVARALNSLAETLQQEEALRKESVADLAHELRTPVMGLLGRIEAAQDGVFSEQSANLEAMHEEALRLSRLLDDISSLADAQRPGMLLERAPVDLAAIAARQVAAVAGEFGKKGIAVETELEPVVVDGDAGRLQQILTNLLSNALRYTDGGVVTVRTFAEGESAVLEVEDTGIGIADGDLDHVFDRFWRSEKSRSRSTGGAGIGLAVVKGLTQAHGGGVQVTSTLGEGSRFRVTLPQAG